MQWNYSSVTITNNENIELFPVSKGKVMVLF